MRILYIAPQPLYEDRGSPIAIYEELKALSELSFNVDVVTYPLGRTIEIPLIRLIRVANPLRFKSVKVGFSLKKLFLDVLILKKIFYLFRNKQYDCMHGVEEGAGIALLCKIFFKVPVIYDMQSSIPEQLRDVRFFKSGFGRWLAIWLERWLVKNADVMYVTKGLADRVFSIVPGKNIWEYSFPSVELDQSDNSSYAHYELLKCPNIVYTGNFSPYQGLELLIEATSHLSKKIKDVKLFLVGGTDAEILKLRKLIKQFGLEDRVHLHPRVPRTEISSILDRSCVLALPRPRGSNVPLKIYEYINSNSPIVATNIKAHTSILNNHNATLVEPNAVALAGGILDVINSKCKVKHTVSKSKNTAEIPLNNLIKPTIKKAYNCIINL